MPDPHFVLFCFFVWLKKSINIKGIHYIGLLTCLIKGIKIGYIESNNGGDLEAQPVKEVSIESPSTTATASEEKTSPSSWHEF